MKQALVGILALGLAFGMYSVTRQQQKNKVPAVQKQSSSSGATTKDAEVKVVNLEAGSFYYKPNVIEITKGQKIKIVMNSVSMIHDFNIDELGVKIPIVKDGDTGTIEFTADKVGSFEYYCSVGQHRANGQVGTLTVK
ncbi:hypothetical protein COY90_01080 [Candidatus Roizmanbacteria bacterium CG_4_10_14_0_8_um_filter_39_9]|uniref:EfeO-type cupredoxin-like domain-containing protein n=1 Tax=Candidatus Roizmanbacteria bacterium CG_4_10_14_0_8_um_filter_39_9 TaxID=1974829 RepID=A0A2M7QEL1_9BACT|nr:MAG: hypothetical protein COY90_01080 [Candidatus Roizmanbacteria bacterium CG_4_10_14_0_8_um_filter_39_9]